MIRETLETLVASSSMSDMAERMGIGMDDLRLRLTLLEEKGFLRRTGGEACESSCGRHCPGCVSAPAASAEGYELTDKGRKVLERN
jgi:hypothetical protein